MLSLLDAILTVFDELSTWIQDSLLTLSALFWNSAADGTGGLTFFGILAVVGLGISVIFLLLRVIQNFLHFRG